MLRERQLIQEQVQKEDEMKAQKDAQKLVLKGLMAEKMRLEQKVKELESQNKSTGSDINLNEANSSTNPSSQSPPSQPPPSAPDTSPQLEQMRIEAQQSKEDLARVLSKLSQREHEHNQLNSALEKSKSDLKEKTERNAYLETRNVELEKECRLSRDKLETAKQKMERATKDTERFHHQQTLLQSITNDFKQTQERNKIIEQVE